MAQSVKGELVNALAGSVPFLRLAGTALGGWLLARSALVAQGKLATRDGDPAFLEAKLITARFYAEVILPPALAQLGPLKAAGRTVFALTEDSSNCLNRAARGRGARLRRRASIWRGSSRLSSTIPSPATTRCAASRR